MPKSDPHCSCLQCLRESHQKKCRICKGFCPRTLKDRDQRLKILLMEVHSNHNPTYAQQNPRPAPHHQCAVHKPVPRKDAKESRQRHSSAHRQCSVRHWSQSLVPQKKKRPERGRSSPSKPKKPAAGGPDSGNVTSAPPPWDIVESEPSLLSRWTCCTAPAPLNARGIRGVSDLMRLMVPSSPQSRDKLPVTAQPLFPLKGKPAMMAY